MSMEIPITWKCHEQDDQEGRENLAGQRLVPAVHGPEDGGGDGVAGAGVEEQDKVLGGPQVLVQVQIHFSVVDDGVVGLDVGDGVLGIQDLDERHLDYSKDMLQRRLTVVLR